MIAPTRWLTAQELADYLGFSRATVYRLVAEGHIPHRRLAGLGLRFSPADIAEIEAMAERPPGAYRAST